MNNGIYYNKSASIPERERSQPAKRFVSFIYILLFALSLLRAEKEPSFAYLFNGSRTTLRECCDGRESHNHPMFGSVVGSFMRILLGIPRSLAGMEQGLLVAPYIPRDMEWVAGYTQTPWGRLSVEWKRSARGALRIAVEAPDSIEGRLQYGGRSWRLAGGKTAIRKTAITIME